jgi:hypothetical protein
MGRRPCGHADDPTAEAHLAEQFGPAGNGCSHSPVLHCLSGSDVRGSPQIATVYVYSSPASRRRRSRHCCVPNLAGLGCMGRPFALSATSTIHRSCDAARRYHARCRWPACTTVAAGRRQGRPPARVVAGSPRWAGVPQAAAPLNNLDQRDKALPGQLGRPHRPCGDLAGHPERGPAKLRVDARRDLIVDEVGGGTPKKSARAPGVAWSGCRAARYADAGPTTPRSSAHWQRYGDF